MSNPEPTTKAAIEALRDQVKVASKSGQRHIQIGLGQARFLLDRLAALPVAQDPEPDVVVYDGKRWRVKFIKSDWSGPCLVPIPTPDR